MMDLSQFTTVSLPLHDFVMLIFLVVTGIYAIYSAILYYHWREYATDTQVTIYTLVTYFATTLPLIIVMGVLALIIN